MTKNNIDTIVDTVVSRIYEVMDQTFEIEASGRHIHLNREAIDSLFGDGYQLHPSKYLSQPGEFASEERVSIKGPKGIIHNVIILGPERKNCQVEVSLTDARSLGVNAPVQLSGNIENTPGIILMNGSKSFVLDKGVIVAKRHLHVKDIDAERLGVKDKERVSVQVFSERPLIFDDVIVRVSPKFETSMHIDYDEANACGHKKGVRGRIVKR
ncbi:phosphate propanoyltransferase [Tissierella carlieri]|jgi:putative phosphotransacetylase|uniref:ethanolamine utilization phosphate acetyltransferase EutD n=1 Tax=Tissierella carlieri TaxID=689904 RepID=UPI001C10123B|nr:ethanolamine utilization phosphate acetyltransferase EutD [Tissierella carlieri]MBU5314405.1 phosphate propanoyltransferase [Tissierella carlieri]